MDLKELYEQKGRVVKQAREIIDTCLAEGREMTVEERAKYNKLEEELDNIEKLIYNLVMERESRQTLVGGKEDPGEIPRTSGEKVEHRAAFWKYFRWGVNILSPDEYRALQTTTGPEGGYLVPASFEKVLIQKLEDQNVMRRLATVISTSSQTTIPIVTSHGTASWVAESGAYAESDERFDVTLLGAYKLGILIKISEELLRDSAFDLEQYIASEFARRIGAAEEQAFIAGDGVGKPTGVLQNATQGVVGAAGQTTSVTADDIISLYYALKAPYRARAVWLMHDSTAKAIRSLKDTTGQYLWQPGLTAGTPDTLLGRPVITSPYMPAMAANAKSILFGDFSYYWIADRQGREFQRLVELYANYGQVGYRAWQRVDGKLTLAEAVVYYQNSAT